MHIMAVADVQSRADSQGQQHTMTVERGACAAILGFGVKDVM